MSVIYYLVCEEKKIAVPIGDDAAGDPFIWAELIPYMNNFLTITKGCNIKTVTDDDENFDDWHDEYLILGDEDVK